MVIPLSLLNFSYKKKADASPEKEQASWLSTEALIRQKLLSSHWSSPCQCPSIRGDLGAGHAPNPDDAYTVLHMLQKGKNSTFHWIYTDIR